MPRDFVLPSNKIQDFCRFFDKRMLLRRQQIRSSR